MSQVLVIHEKYFSLLTNNLSILIEKGYYSAEEFIRGIIKKLNDEYNFFEIDNYRFFTTKEEFSEYSQYGGYIDGENLPFDKVVVFFTPIDSKLGNVIVEQSFMPTICNQMEKDLTFLCNNNFKKIALLTSKINADNEVSLEYNKIQMDINSLNTLNFDVIAFLPIKNLSTDTKFNSLTEYLDMSNYLQRKSKSNSQVEYLHVENSILYGECEAEQLEGEFIKSYCFRYLTAIFSGGNDFKYNIDKILNKLNKLNNQFANLKRFVDYANSTLITQMPVPITIDDDIIETDEELFDYENMHRMPEKGVDNKGRKRFKTFKKIRDSVLERANYLCNCNDSKHFYFESVDLHNYVEGHHIVPMNRQEEYYYDNGINLDIPNNIIPLCPNCHCQIHLGSRSARIKIISEIYVRNKAKLFSFNPNLSLSILASYYNIGLDSEEEKDWLRKAYMAIEQKTQGK